MTPVSQLKGSYLQASLQELIIVSKVNDGVNVAVGGNFLDPLASTPNNSFEQNISEHDPFPIHKHLICQTLGMKLSKPFGFLHEFPPFLGMKH